MQRHAAWFAPCSCPDMSLWLKITSSCSPEQEAVIKASVPTRRHNLGSCITMGLTTGFEGEIMYKHLFKIAPVAKQLFPVSVRNRYRDWSCSEEEAGHTLCCLS